jgi:cytochrome c6
MAIQNSIGRKLVLRISIVSSFLFTTSCSSDPKISETGNTEKEPTAKELFDQNCASCHGVDGKLGNSGAKDLTKSKISDADILKIIEEGKNGMPPMKALLESDSNISNVAEYIKKMRK